MNVCKTNKSRCWKAFSADLRALKLREGGPRRVRPVVQILRLSRRIEVKDLIEDASESFFRRGYGAHCNLVTIHMNNYP